MHDLQKFMKSTGVYLVGNVLIKATQFLLLPLYTKYINPNDYGLFDLYVAYITFLSSILFFDIWSGIMRFMFDYDTEAEQAKPITNGLIIFAGSTIVYTICTIIMGNIFDIPYIEWLYLYGLTANMAQVLGYVARALHKDYIYILGGVIGTLVNVISNILFIAVLKWNYQYLYISYCIGMMVNIYIVAKNIHFVSLIKKSNFEKKLLKEMLGFSLPLSLNSAAFWFLTSYNKLVINQQLSATENGLYAVASKFSTMINLVTQCFQMAWQELTFSKAGKSKEEMEQFYTTAINEYMKFMGLGMLLLIPFVKVIFPIMIDKAYAGAEILIPITFLGALFQCLGTFFASILSTLKKNQMLFTTTMAGSIVNILCIHLLIGRMGIFAAVISWAVGYFLVVIRRIRLLKKYLMIKIDRNLIGLFFLFFGVVYVIYIYGSYILNFIEFCILMSIVLFCYRKIIKEFIRKNVVERG